jgi:bifunctional UDP-N-acetylglucosamine pyrophosphorylase / glucosamine-1-phosphate N-acetyltransferase
MQVSSVILAAGKGTRMHSRLPKPLHPLLGRPMVSYSLEAAQKATQTTPILVVGHGAEQIEHEVGEAACYVQQTPQLGTGHALKQVEPLIRGKADMVLVTAVDMPLVRVDTLQRLIATHQQPIGQKLAPITLASVCGQDPRGFGRIVRDSQGEISAVLEEAQATPEQLKIKEYNTSLYCFSAEWLWSALPRIPLSPKGEYYLTDLVAIAVADSMSVRSLTVEDPEEFIGINTRIHLATAEAVLRKRVNNRWMLKGVTFIDPATTYIESGVTIGQDTIIWPNTHLRGNTQIGSACTIGPNCVIQDTIIGNECKINFSVLDQAQLENRVEVGPFAHFRKGTHLADGVHIGNFGELKNSYLGEGTKVGHFSYIGDATIGPHVNIGAGTITCNFDGVKKHQTEIGEGAFIGSDTMLVAPLTIGENATTGAGSVVTKDVPPDSVAVGIPARVIRKKAKREQP